MSNRSSNELYLQQLYNEKIGNIIKHIENEKKTAKKCLNEKYEKENKRTQSTLKENVRKTLFQNISKEILEKNEKMKNQLRARNNIPIENKLNPLPMHISKLNYCKFNTHSITHSSSQQNALHNHMQEGLQTKTNQIQIPYYYSHKQNSQTLLNRTLPTHHETSRGITQESFQNNLHRKTLIGIAREKEESFRGMGPIETQSPIDNKPIMPVKKKCNTDISGLIHAYKAFKEQEEKKEKEMKIEKSKREERTPYNRNLIQDNNTCKKKIEIGSEESTEEHMIKEEYKRPMHSSIIYNEIVPTICPIEYPLHKKENYNDACSENNFHNETYEENGSNGEIIEKNKNTQNYNRKKSTNINDMDIRKITQHKSISNQHTLVDSNKKYKPNNQTAFFDIMKAQKREVCLKHMNVQFTQNRSVNIQMNQAYQCNASKKEKIWNASEMQYAERSKMKESRNRNSQRSNENCKYNELVYRNLLEMERERNQESCETYSMYTPNKMKNLNEPKDYSNINPTEGEEKGSNVESSEEENSFNTYNNIVLYNEECNATYIQTGPIKKTLYNKTSSEIENNNNENKNKKEYNSNVHYSIESIISNKSSRNPKQNIWKYKNLKREEVNFFSNDDLSSFDLTDQSNMMKQNKHLNNYNDILCVDIEEKKTNKLFFEEICVYRMNERSESNHFHHTPINLFKDKSLNELALEKLEIHKKHYKDINDEIKNLIPQEDVYEVEMNVGLLFRKFVPVTMSLSCKYLLIQKNENNLITCISYRNITKLEMVKKNDNKRIYLFKLVYIFKKKKEQSVKNVTLLFRTNKSEMFDKIKDKVHPLLLLENPKKDFLDIETVYTYIIQKYKTVHALYLKHLLQNVEKILRKKLYVQSFYILKMKCALSKKVEQMKNNKKKNVQEGFIKMEECLKKIGKKYFQALVMKSYEHSLVNYQVKTNNLLYEMLTKEKTVYQENIDKQNAFLLCSILSIFYKKKMRSYFDHFVKNNRILHRGKEAFVYVITHVNSIFTKYQKRNKTYVLNLLRFDYDKVSHFSFVLYKLYLRRVIVGYLAIRDNQKRRKFLLQKHVLHLVKVLIKVVDRMKHYAFTKIQKHVYEEKERKNVLLLDSLVSANDELCNNLDKVTIEKGINKIECLYKFKLKECLVKFFFKLRGPQINNGSFSHCLKHCSIFIFVLNKVAYRKIQKHFFHFVLKCLQDNNTNRLIYSMKKLECVAEKKEKRYVFELLQFYEQYPYLFKYRHLTKIEVFINSITNFIILYNRKLMLNFFLKLHYIKYQGQVIKAYTCIGNLYKFIKVLNHEIHSHVQESFEKLVLNAREQRYKILEEQCKETKSKINNLTKVNIKENKKTYKKMNYSSDDISPDGYNFMKKYPLLFHNSNITSEYTTTLTDDKWSMKSADSITHSLSHTYDDMDQIKKKICSFNSKISKMK